MEQSPHYRGLVNYAVVVVVVLLVDEVVLLVDEVELVVEVVELVVVVVVGQTLFALNLDSRAVKYFLNSAGKPGLD